MHESTTILARLMAVIDARKRDLPPGSYTAELLHGGIEAVGAKVLEEAGELVEAARAENAAGAVIGEAADLVYHLLVLLAHCNLQLADVEAELKRRFGTSGLDEKVSRPPPDESA